MYTIDHVGVCQNKHANALLVFDLIVQDAGWLELLVPSLITVEVPLCRSCSQKLFWACQFRLELLALHLFRQVPRSHTHVNYQYTRGSRGSVLRQESYEGQRGGKHGQGHVNIRPGLTDVHICQQGSQAEAVASESRHEKASFSSDNDNETTVVLIIRINFFSALWLIIQVWNRHRRNHHALWAII